MDLQYFTFENHRIAFRRAGYGPDVIFLHGFPTHSLDWEPVAGALSSSYRTWAPDFLGFGASDKPKNHSYSLFEQADMIEAFAASQKLRSVDLVCHDYGDSVGLELMTRARERFLKFKVRSVTLLNGGIYFDLAQLRPVQRLLEVPGLGSVVARLFTRELFHRQFNALLSPRHQLASNHLDRLWDLMTHNRGREVVPSLIGYLRERRKFSASRWERTLESLDIPLCILWGAFDPVAVLAMAETVRARHKKALIHILEDVGHYPQLEVPSLVVERLREFLQSAKIA